MLEDLVQLHESIEIIYVVDGYQATLTTLDGRVEAASARGITIQDALDNLKLVVLHTTLEDVRATK